VDRDGRPDSAIDTVEGVEDEHGEGNSGEDGGDEHEINKITIDVPVAMWVSPAVFLQCKFLTCYSNSGL
jgi:hypothetical protein